VNGVRRRGDPAVSSPPLRNGGGGAPRQRRYGGGLLGSTSYRSPRGAITSAQHVGKALGNLLSEAISFHDGAAVSGVTFGGDEQRAIRVQAPSTTLRVVPLPRFAGEEKLIVVQPLRGFAELFETYKFGRQLCFASLAARQALRAPILLEVGKKGRCPVISTILNNARAKLGDRAPPINQPPRPIRRNTSAAARSVSRSGV
jgi:hypothetical protein